MASTKSRSSAPVLPLALHHSLSLTRRSSLIGFDLARAVSPKRNLQVRSPVGAVLPKAVQRTAVPSTPARRMCLCSPSNHPGAFRCSLHKNCSSSAPFNSQLHMRKSAMKSSLVRIGNVAGEEEWMKRALIRPSTRQVRRRRSFPEDPAVACSTQLTICSVEEDGTAAHGSTVVCCLLMIYFNDTNPQLN